MFIIKVYNYNDEGIYTGEEIAQESPLEKGVYLIPANSTTVPPLMCIAGKKRRFKDGAWYYMDCLNKSCDKPVDLTIIKLSAITYIKNLCRLAICDGFYSEVTGVKHTYRFDTDTDQHNFEQQAIRFITHPELYEVLWNTDDCGDILHTREQFFTLLDEAYEMKQTNINKYRNIKQMIINCTTLEEINNISWN